MGRTRTIDRSAVLDVAEAIVRRCGAAGLTLEAVASEAGISKASVLYDYKTKHGLIRAMIERRVAAEEARVATYVDALQGCPDAQIRGRLAAAQRDVPDDDRTVALGLYAALAQDADLREPIQSSYAKIIAGIADQSSHPRGAMLAFLALKGLLSLEWLGLHNWSETERRCLVEEIGWLIDQSPPAANAPNQA